MPKPQKDKLRKISRKRLDEFEEAIRAEEAAMAGYNGRGIAECEEATETARINLEKHIAYLERK